jgi:hypothetical protein
MGVEKVKALSVVKLPDEAKKKINHRRSQLSEGLLFPSESDFPLEPFIWELATLTPETILTRSELAIII